LRTKLLAAKHLIISDRTKFDTEQKYLKFLLEIMTLVSSQNTVGCDREFILRWRSFINVMNKLLLGEFHVSIFPQKKKIVELGDFTSTFCLLLANWTW